MNCGHSDVLGKIDLKSVKRRPARGVLGGAESVEWCTDVHGKVPGHVGRGLMNIGAPSAPFLLTFGHSRGRRRKE